MSRAATRRRPATRAARRDTTAYRNRFVALAARAAKPGDPAAGTGRTPAPAAPARVKPRYIHEEELTGQAREDVAEALRKFLANQRTKEVGYTGDIEVAYHNGYLLSAAWLLFHATEAHELGAVFDRYGISVHPDWWLTDGWRDFHDKWGVKCPDCEGYNYARPPAFSDNPADADWPGQCHNCGHDLPAQHFPDTYGSDSTWWATCTCGWEPGKSYKTQGAAKGAVTRHLKSTAPATA